MPRSTAKTDPDAAIRIALVEDDAPCRQALVGAIASSPDLELVWQASTLHQARVLLGAPIDVLLVDLGLPDGSGLELIREFTATHTSGAVMVSTMFGDDDHLLAAVHAGALGYLLKDVSATEMLDEIRSLHAGGSPINPMMARKLLRRPDLGAPLPEVAPPPEAPSDAPDWRLSPRETQVLQLVARGHILDEVATTMGITRHTARSFVRRIYQKLQVNNRVEAVQLAMRQGIL